MVSYALWEYSGANYRFFSCLESDVPTRSMAGMPVFKDYCHLLYISSEGLDSNTLGGLVGHLGTGEINEFVNTDRFSSEWKSTSARLRHLLLTECFESIWVGWSVSGERMLGTLVFAIFSLRNDLVYSAVDDRITLPFNDFPPLGMNAFSSCGVLILIRFLIDGESVFRNESQRMTEPLLFRVDWYYYFRWFGSQGSTSNNLNVCSRLIFLEDSTD